MNKILFPTEFSKHAKNVFLYAIEFAHRFDAEILLLHVITDTEFKILDNQSFNVRAKRALQQLSDFAHKYIPEDYSDLKFQCIVEHGYPQDGIYKIAKEEEVDIIVMGMQGANYALDKMLGSISTEITKTVDCPVLMIPTNAKFKIIDNLVYALDFEFRDLVAINFLKEWAKFLDAVLHCVHVMEKDEKQHIVERNIETLYEIYKNKKRKMGKVTFEVITGKLEEAILKFTETVAVDILVMATHQRNLLQNLWQQNTTLKVASDIQIPLLILKID